MKFVNGSNGNVLHIDNKTSHMCFLVKKTALVEVQKPLPKPTKQKHKLIKEQHKLLSLVVQQKKINILKSISLLKLTSYDQNIHVYLKSTLEYTISVLTGITILLGIR